MAEYTKTNAVSRVAPKARWETIMEMPEDTWLYRLDTTERLKVGMLKPAFHGTSSTLFRTFVMRTDPNIEVPVEMLRLVGDGRFSDTLMRKEG